MISAVHGEICPQQSYSKLLSQWPKTVEFETVDTKCLRHASCVFLVQSTNGQIIYLSVKQIVTGYGGCT